jgi:hypothetical protein
LTLHRYKKVNADLGEKKFQVFYDEIVGRISRRRTYLESGLDFDEAVSLLKEHSVISVLHFDLNVNGNGHDAEAVFISNENFFLETVFFCKLSRK